MTRFEKDYKEVKENASTEVLRTRKAELDKLIAEGKSCKNAYRRQCIAQEVARLQAEYNILDKMF